MPDDIYKCIRKFSSIRLFFYKTQRKNVSKSIFSQILLNFNVKSYFTELTSSVATLQINEQVLLYRPLFCMKTKGSNSHIDGSKETQIFWQGLLFSTPTVDLYTQKHKWWTSDPSGNTRNLVNLRHSVSFVCESLHFVNDIVVCYNDIYRHKQENLCVRTHTRRCLIQLLTLVYSYRHVTVDFTERLSMKVM